MITSEEITRLNERLTKAHKANDALKVQREVYEKTLREKATRLKELGVEGIDPSADIDTLIKQIQDAYEVYSKDLQKQVDFNTKLLSLVEAGDYKGAEQMLGTPSRNSVKVVQQSETQTTELPTISLDVVPDVEDDEEDVPDIVVSSQGTLMLDKKIVPQSSDDLDDILNDAMFSFGEE